MTKAHANRNLLFGIFALQNDMISREDLIAAVSAWMLDKTKPLDRILLEQDRLTPEAHALIEPLVRLHLKQHDDDPERSLASLEPSDAVREALAAVPDADIQASLGHVGAP